MIPLPGHPKVLKFSKTIIFSDALVIPLPGHPKVLKGAEEAEITPLQFSKIIIFSDALVIPLPGHPKVLKSTRGDLRSGKSYDIALVSVTNVFGQKCSFISSFIS